MVIDLALGCQVEIALQIHKEQIGYTGKYNFKGRETKEGVVLHQNVAADRFPDFNHIVKIGIIICTVWVRKALKYSS